MLFFLDFVNRQHLVMNLILTSFIINYTTA